MNNLYYVNVNKVIGDIETVTINLYCNVKNSSYTNCPICYDDFRSDDIVRILNCGHIYHRSCIDYNLINISVACPYCKKDAGEFKYINL